MSFLKQTRTLRQPFSGRVLFQSLSRGSVYSFFVALMALLCSGDAVLAAQPDEEKNISGTIITGFRVIDVDHGSTDNRLTVYRGDYVKFSYPHKYGALEFTVPQLDYKAVLDPDLEKAPFVKMKSTGNYPFRLGEAGGSITVIDLVRPNYTEVTADEAAKLLQNLSPFILDVRTPEEYQQIHIEGTHLIPIQELQARMKELETKKHEDIFVYCATGNRSTVAARILADGGFKRIYNLRYGVHDWARQGHPYNTLK